MKANAARAPAPAARDPGSRVAAVGAAAICGATLAALGATTGAATDRGSTPGAAGTPTGGGPSPPDAWGRSAAGGGSAVVERSSSGWNEAAFGSANETAKGVVSAGSGTSATSRTPPLENAESSCQLSCEPETVALLWCAQSYVGRLSQVWSALADQLVVTRHASTAGIVGGGSPDRVRL